MENLSVQTEYERFAAMCQCGLRNVLASIENIRQQMSLSDDRNPFSIVTSRIKTLDSAIEKCERKYGEASISRLRSLQDIAGVRIITDFEDDIFVIHDMLTRVPTCTVIEKNDYIANPKPNGYRSLHLIVTVNIFFEGRSRMVPVEIQIRDKAMDLWASLEHIIKYKHPNPSPEIVGQFKRIADSLAKFDKDAMRIRDEAASNDN